MFYAKIVENPVGEETVDLIAGGGVITVNPASTALTAFETFAEAQAFAGDRPLTFGGKAFTPEVAPELSKINQAFLAVLLDWQSNTPYEQRRQAVVESFELLGPDASVTDYIQVAMDSINPGGFNILE